MDENGGAQRRRALKQAIIIPVFRELLIYRFTILCYFSRLVTSTNLKLELRSMVKATNDELDVCSFRSRPSEGEYGTPHCLGRAFCLCFYIITSSHRNCDVLANLN